MAIRVFNNDTGESLGTLTDEQLQFLIDQLEEEFPEDQDYWLNPSTLSLLEKAGADAELLALLRRALGDGEGVEIRWSRE
jgi:processive 1,2-diacylglycerol beta-glucosyltransferase